MSLQNLINKLDKLLPTVAQSIGEELIKNTPKDTTHAVANWRVSVDKKNTSELGSYPGSGGGTVIAQSALTNALFKFDIDNNRFISFDQNVHYFPYLDTKPYHSKKAPEGVTGPSIEAGLRKAMNKLGF